MLAYLATSDSQALWDVNSLVCGRGLLLNPRKQRATGGARLESQGVQGNRGH